MTKEFISRRTSLPLQRAKSPFSPRPFPPPVQAQAQDNPTAAPSVKHSSQNSNLLSRLTHSEPVPESQQIGPEFGIESPENQHKIQRKRQDSFAQVSAVPTTPPSAPRFPIQAKLTVGAAGDKYEQEADYVARQVVNRIQAPQVNHQSSESNPVQRKIASQAFGGEGGDVSSEREGQLNQARAGGQRLSPSLKEPMEGEFGADFSGALPETPTVTVADKISTDQVDGSKIARFSTGNNEEELFCNPDLYLEKIADEVKNTLNKIDRAISAYETIKEAIKKIHKVRGLAQLSGMEIARGAATKLSGAKMAFSAIDAGFFLTVAASKAIAYATWSVTHPERVDELMESLDDMPTSLLSLALAPSKSLTTVKKLTNAVRRVKKSSQNLKEAKNNQETLAILYELKQAIKAAIDIAHQILEIDIVKKFVEENLQPALQQINKTITTILEYNPILDSSTQDETKDEGDTAYSPFKSVVESIKGSSFGQYLE